MKLDNIKKLILAQFIGGLYFAIPIQTLFYLAKGVSFSQLIFLESVVLAFNILFEVPTGIIGDKIGRKWSITLGYLMLILSWIPFFMADRNYFIYSISFAITGIAIAFFSGAEEALIYDELKSKKQEDQMQKIYGYFSGALSLAAVASSLIGGFLAIKQDMASFYLVFRLSLIAEIVGLLIMLTVKEPPIFSKTGEQIEHQAEGSITLLKDGLRLLKENIDLRRIALLQIFSTPFVAILTYGFQPYFKLAGVSNIYFGVATSIAALLNFFVIINAYRLEKRFGLTRSLMIVNLSPAVLWILMGLFINPVIAVILYITFDSICGLREPIYSGFKNKHITSYNRATVLSTIALVSGFYFMITRPLLGKLVEYNLPLGFIVIGVIGIVFSLIFRIKDSQSQAGASINNIIPDSITPTQRETLDNLPR